MIVCKSCGQHNGDVEEFCTNCGRYLEWSGERVDEPEPEPEPEPEEVVAEPMHRPGLIERVRQVLIPSRRPGETADDRTAATATVSSVSNATVSEPAVTAPPDTVVSRATVSGALEDTAEVASVPGSPVQGSLVPGAPVAASTTSSTDALVGGGTAMTVTGATTALSGTGEVVSAGTPSPEVLLLSRPDVSVDEPVGSGGDAGHAGSGEGKVTAPRKPGEPGRGHTRRRRTTPLLVPQNLPANPLPGDIYCSRCNQFNSPSRRFCRRCGEELTHPEDAEPTYEEIPWWRRWLHRDVRIVSAGARPGRWGRASSGGGGAGRMTRITLRVMGLVIGALLVLSFLGPASQPIQKWFKSTYDKVIHNVDITYTQQFATGANATSALPNHSAGLAVDDADNTYWESKPGKHDGAGQTLTIVFISPTAIDRIGVISGAGPAAQDFVKTARPKQILITYGTQHVTETLKDTHSFQHLDLHIPKVGSLTIKILSVYPSPVGRSVAITEVEFFKRS